MFMPDGNIYIMSIWGMPSGTTNPIGYNGCAFYIQKAVLDHYGRAPKTVDEYFEFINGYKEEFPEIDGVPTIGYAAQMNDWRVWSLMHPSKFLQGYGNWGDVGVADLATDTAMDPYPEPYYRTYIEKLNEEYLKGTLPGEFFTYDHDQFLATIASGAVLGMFDQEWNFGSAQDVLRQEGRHERTYIPLGLTYDESIKGHYIDQGMFDLNNGFGISANSDHAERIMKLCNYLMQEDVQRWLSWGIEGEHYNVENGRFVRPDEQRDLQIDPQWVRDNMGRWYRDLWPKIDGTFTDGNATGPGTQNEEAWDSLPEYDQNLFTKLGIENRIAYLGDPVQIKPYYPFYSKKTFNNDGSAADLGWVNQAEYMKVSLVKLVTAEEGAFDGLYDEYLEGLAEIDMTATMEQLQKDIEYYLSIAENF
jgi:putative aldouronate transport system substrate-binding protein